MIDVTRRGFLAGLLGTAVVVALPKNIALLEQPLPVAPIDPFAITAPPGWRYQWVRTHIMPGVPDTSDLEARLQNAWTFVEPKLYPGAPVATVENAIASSGLILMQKPEADVRAQQLAELRAREARHPRPHRVLVETPHGFEFQAKPKPKEGFDVGDASDCEHHTQQPDEDRRTKAS